MSVVAKVAGGGSGCESGGDGGGRIGEIWLTQCGVAQGVGLHM